MTHEQALPRVSDQTWQRDERATATRDRCTAPASRRGTLGTEAAALCICSAGRSSRDGRTANTASRAHVRRSPSVKTNGATQMPPAFLSPSVSGQWVFLAVGHREPHQHVSEPRRPFLCPEWTGPASQQQDNGGRQSELEHVVFSAPSVKAEADGGSLVSVGPRRDGIGRTETRARTTRGGTTSSPARHGRDRRKRTKAYAHNGRLLLGRSLVPVSVTPESGHSPLAWDFSLLSTFLTSLLLGLDIVRLDLSKFIR